MAFVIDTNIVLEWLLREPSTVTGRRAEARARHEGMIGPSQLWAEVHTGLLKRRRAGAITQEQYVRAAASFGALPLVFDETAEPPRPRLLILAERHGLTLYDAFFLDAAAERSLPLATNDRALRRAAEAEGVPLV